MVGDSAEAFNLQCWRVKVVKVLNNNNFVIRFYLLVFLLAKCCFVQHSSPPLLKTGPRTRASPIYRRRLVSPERAQEIARDREMLMHMIQNMPEDSYELSLKDIVENSMVKEVEQGTVTLEKREKSKEHLSPSKRGKMRGNGKRKGLLRTGSMNDEHIALKMFIPTSLSIRKSSKMDPCSKITPRPRLLQEEKVFDKQWWKNKFSVAGESEKNKAGSMNKSRACYSTGRQVYFINNYDVISTLYFFFLYIEHFSFFHA
ncbi:hypothetical protein IFM89_031781 [Coptis chinensis]|uniref:Uncharacterized protein n=1 Tax=Coptis chinensis TaxID=261450 RepID=A0A835IZD6_9MAGN|nr:hypothetical protein IFM89_031781 [Coptis chinensis]